MQCSFSKPILLAGFLISIGTNAFGSVLIMGSNSDSWNGEVAAKISGTGLISGSVDTFDAQIGTPSLALLANYSAVLVYSDGPYADNYLMGEVLADYVDGGGGVVEATFSFWNSASTLGMSGRWDTTPYSIWQKNAQASITSLSLGTVHVPLHPILSGVNSFNGGIASFHNTVGPLNPGATLIASYNNGVDFIAENVTSFPGKIVGLNFYPPSNDSRSDLWDSTTDGALIMANSLNHVAGTFNAPVPDLGNNLFSMGTLFCTLFLLRRPR